MSATVSRDLLAQAPRFFGDGLNEIAAALLQNARRAGASQVTVSTNPDTGTMPVTDDGSGLGKGAADLLICFGGSLWDNATAEDERPAGIGSHALAARGASVRSRDWRMSVTPAAFVGDEVATVTSAPTMGSGFSVSFPDPAIRGVERRDAVRR